MAEILEGIAGGATAASLDTLKTKKALAREVQQRLEDIGLLDPPVDGDFGAGSSWALRTFLKKKELQDKTSIDKEVAEALLAADPRTLFPIRTNSGDFAARIVKAMIAKGHWIQRHPDCLNIVYVEGMDPDGKANGNVENHFNDLRILIRINDAGVPVLEGNWIATTEPGRHFTFNLAPGVKVGAARIALGQQKAWRIGTHNANSVNGHESLIQVGTLSVHRDKDRNFKRDNDPVDTNNNFGINQHRAFGEPVTNIGLASAGCLVGHKRAEHETFIRLLKKDARFMASAGYQFMTTVMEARDVP
jgi:hypothetical protein